MSWKSKVLGKTDPRTAKVSSIASPTKKGYVEVEFDNQDVGQAKQSDWTFPEGTEVTYSLETREWSSPNSDPFLVVNIVDFGEPTAQEGVARRKPVKFLSSYHPKKVLFFDIECVRMNKTLKNKSPEFESWKYKRRKYEETTVKALQDSYKTDAALYAEFGKVVCVSIGRIDKDNKIVLQSFYGHDEREILQKTSEAFKAFTSRGFALGGFGVKGYDVPFLMRRMLINQVEIPECLDVAGAKPWEVKIIDANELWKSTGFYSASLLNVATAMGLESPKTSMDGSEVSDVYYESADNIHEIAKYGERDVVTTINITMPMFGLPFITEVISKTFDDGGE